MVKLAGTSSIYDMIEFKNYDSYDLFLDDVVNRNTLSRSNDLIIVIGKKGFINTCAIYLALQYEYSIDVVNDVNNISNISNVDDVSVALCVSRNNDCINKDVYNEKRYCMEIVDVDDVCYISMQYDYIRSFINSDNNNEESKYMFDVIDMCLESHNEVMVFNVLNNNMNNK